jgi:predicted DNA-binding protein (MmcQ/YjbR family)
VARRDPFAAAEAALRKFALAFPESTEDFPWDHRAIKVRGKMFLILSRDPERDCFNATVKLPVSGSQALQMAFAEPTGYGLGKHGWVTASFTADIAIPLNLLREWIDESFRAVAPKTVLGKMEQAESGEMVSKPKAKRKKPT